MTGPGESYLRWVTKIIAIMFASFHFYTGAFGLFPHMQQRAIHMMFGLVLTFLVTKSTGRREKGELIKPWDIVFIIMSILGCVTVYLKYITYLSFMGESTRWDIFMGITTTILIIEAGRRTVGWIFPIITISMICYALFGFFIPGKWGHGGFRLEYIIQTLYQTDKGIFGPITGVSASLIAMFIIFGVIITFSGGGETFKDIAMILAGRFRGGPAMAAVLASAFFGTVSGSAVANTATTGNFTIPLMKRLGYSPEFAGGVEAAASTGGQIMPPIRASGAFVMAELLGLPYLTICIAALVPALLYFLCMFSSIWFEAIKVDLPRVPEDEIPRIQTVVTWARLAPLVIPFCTLIVFLAMGYTPYRSCFYAICLSVTIYVLRDFRLKQILHRIKNMINASEKGAIALIDIAALCACAQIFVSLLFLTGLGGKFSEAFLALSGTNLPVALVFSALVALILGMGMPSVAAYILAISVIGPSLILIGIPPLNAHFFVFYFAIISATTPPVCVAAFTAAVIAQTSWIKVAWVAMRIAVVKYFMPFLFVLAPVFLLQGKILEIVIGISSATFGIVIITSSLMGFLHIRHTLVSRTLFFIGGLALFYPDPKTDVIGLLIAGLGFLELRVGLCRKAFGIINSVLISKPKRF